MASDVPDPTTDDLPWPFEEDVCIARLDTYITREKKGLGNGLLKNIHDHDREYIDTVRRSILAGCPGQELATDISLLMFYDLVILIGLALL